MRVVLVAALGTRSSGGYAIHIDSLADQGGTRTVFVTSLQPGVGCAVTTALTAPAHVVSASVGPQTTVFQERSVLYDCS